LVQRVPSRFLASALLLALAAIASAQSSIPDGIPRALAQSRAARVSDLHYQLSYSLIPHASTTAATEVLRFHLANAAEPLLLDFRDGQVSSFTLNGATISAAVQHGHLVLPATNLRTGVNTVEAHFTANIAPAGKAITRFEDKDDGSEYLYTLFVPMDASMAFPCFDQPDLKGRFKLTVTAPPMWNVISNTASSRRFPIPTTDTAAETLFSETEPLPTYLFAFAAGPFVSVHRTPGLPNVWVRKSKAAAAASEVPEVQTTAAEGIRYLSNYFAQPFPFPKYEMVLIPGFAYGGMEHAGCTFLREESVLFRTAPTADNRLGRQILVLHELTHQWFGDFTTMRWFDDLWLKEGFAQYMAYKTLADLRPHDNIWQHFYLSIKPAAYAIDETQGTTPIYQDIPNLDDAKSAYGAIVYSKAPAVLRQLNYILGEAAFRRGLQLYLAAHKYGNATWADLIDAFQTASGRDLASWSDMWIRHRGMPRIDTAWTCYQPPPHVPPPDANARLRRNRPLAHRHANRPRLLQRLRPNPARGFRLSISRRLAPGSRSCLPCLRLRQPRRPRLRPLPPRRKIPRRRPAPARQPWTRRLRPVPPHLIVGIPLELCPPHRP
jgi:aminopeptidase N